MNIQEHLAINVMKWSEAATGWWCGINTDNPKPIYAFRDYDPLTNIEQAMDLLDKFDDWGIDCTPHTKHCCYINDYVDGLDVTIGKAWSDRLPEAICQAVAKASGYETDGNSPELFPGTMDDLNKLNIRKEGE